MIHLHCDDDPFQSDDGAGVDTSLHSFSLELYTEIVNGGLIKKVFFMHKIISVLMALALMSLAAACQPASVGLF